MVDRYTERAAGEPAATGNAGARDAAVGHAAVGHAAGSADRADDLLTGEELRRQLPIAPPRAVASTLWVMLRGRRLRLAGVLLRFLAEAVTALVIPFVTGAIVDTIIAADGTGVPREFWWQVALLVAAAAAAGLLRWSGASSLARLAETLIAELREAYVTSALRLPRASVERAGTGDIVTRASDDIGQISGTLPGVLPRVCVSAFTIALAVGGIGAIDPRMLIGFALTVPFYAATVAWYVRTAPGVYAADRAARSHRGQHILGTLTQLPAVVAHRLERRQLGRIRAAAWRTVRWAMRTRIVQNRLSGNLYLTEGVGLAAVLSVGVWLAAIGASTPGDVTAAALLFLRTVGPIAALMFVMDDLQSAFTSLGRLVGVIESSGQGPSSGSGNEAGAGVGNGAGDGRDPDAAVVRASRLFFAYRPDAPVLSGVDLEIARGEVVAVVGATGSGKSTLAAVLAGVHEPDDGLVERGVPLSAVVTVTQESHLFAGTVRDNLSLAAPDASDDDLRAALERVGAAELVDSLPSGLITPIGHGGETLTAAQAQHLALARVVLADPALVILDEATAETDTADGGVLDRAAAAAIEGRAALVIAHRLSQAAAADRVVVLDDGRVAEQGSHAELLAAGGAYARLWEAWSRGGGSRERAAASPAADAGADV
ncbi:multidrug ABC transporter permease [Pseudoclavibacter endophyticus]|uniref:ABC transporter ATP-binding protein n=1 Tax=Pseudoclavibacter endophyticus TaxID=1778590 RepID=A0A6H9WQ51_9MICO|nr:ABC transporter ATP-binding protein [Pseudoclavibacter endophyticus]KAB1648925.1 ABC transporter ATP-binding protein [Pseudoclavibacter endophyticus]GGA67171.1 multidrug ABC transporter permease [Pseudoclavibacter endophyticus]